jgi:hypothetical protein
MTKMAAAAAFLLLAGIATAGALDLRDLTPVQDRRRSPVRPVSGGNRRRPLEVRDHARLAPS